MFTKAEVSVTEKRNIYVGGSDVPTILGINKYKTQFELAKEKVGITQSDFKGNEYTEYGNIMEPQIRNYINAINETDFQPGSKIDEKQSIRCNVDGYFEEEGMLLEIKTHGKNLNTKPYIAQMQLYMHVLEIEHGWLALYQRTDNFDAEFNPDCLQIVPVEKDADQVNAILNAIETFWIRCEYLKEKPDMSEQEFMSIGQNDVQELANQVEKLELQLASFKEIEQQYKDMKAKLYQAMDEYDVKKWETDRVVITRTLPTTRESLDSKKLKEDLPDVFDSYKKVSKVAGSVRIKLKEAK